MKKICSKCNIEKLISEFHLNKFGKNGYYSQCIDCKNNYKREYNKNNKQKRQEYRKSRKHIGLWRSLLKASLTRLGSKKEGLTIELLGYSATEFKIHIESLFTKGMSWENHGEWHIDHIKDVSSFALTTPPNIVNALSNLRPMWSTTRIIDNVLYEGNLNRNKIRRY